MQLARPELADTIARLLREKSVPVERLRLEVTESSLMRKDAARMLTQLADMGLRLHLDDFGTGYSLLSYLHQLPVDALKIDRLFVNDMVKSDTSASIVATIIALSHALGAHVVAEGVETKEQLEQLRALACDWAQGYDSDRPLDVEKATASLVQARRRPASPRAPPLLARPCPRRPSRHPPGRSWQRPRLRAPRRRPDQVRLRRRRRRTLVAAPVAAPRQPGDTAAGGVIVVDADGRRNQRPQ